MAQKSLPRTMLLLAVALINTYVSAKTVYVTEEVNGTRVVLNTGDTLVVKLKSNPTIGFSWALSGGVGAFLRTEISEMQYDKTGRVGAGGHQVFRYTAVGTGQGSVTLQYRRSFEKNAKPVSEFSVTVVVEE